ncbi:hypothetical protein RclHR1_29640001 [Rhizophagus clarus]|nr:hypothetical protein RclHR1_29640001 [Rhizophagus clarus]
MLLSYYLTLILALVRSWYPKKPEFPILGCVNNTSNIPDLDLTQEMNMDISSSDSHQSTTSQPHTNAVNSLIKTTPKGKDKKKKKKQKTISYDDIDKDFQSSDDSEAEFSQVPLFQPPPPPLHDTVKKIEESSAPPLDSHAGKEKCLKV